MNELLGCFYFFFLPSIQIQNKCYDFLKELWRVPENVLFEVSVPRGQATSSSQG
jgi:hypothetical protein